MAEALHIRTGAVSTAVKTLLSHDVVSKLPDGRYHLADPTFALWLKHQTDFRQAMPPLLVGTESEQAVARRLATEGFRGVYQSRASRGSFDLLAVRDTRVFGIQVKTATLPYSLRASERKRMVAESRLLGFRPVLALVCEGPARPHRLQDDSRKGDRGARGDTPEAGSPLALLH